MKIYGHRGASGYAPENTMEAFRMALAKYDADGVETDVHFSKDGELVLMHDFDLFRTTGSEGRIYEKTLKELKDLDAGSFFSAEFAGAKIPLLSELLELTAEQGKEVNIELKAGSSIYPGIEEAVIRMVYRYSLEKRTIISSFDHYAVCECARLDPAIRTGVLTGSKVYRPEAYLKELHAYAYHPGIEILTKDEVERVHAAGYRVHVYVPNTVEQLESMKKMGVDMVIMNYPDRARQVFGR